MITNTEFAKIFGCTTEEVEKFCYDFFAAKNIDKAVEILENFVDMHPVYDTRGLDIFLEGADTHESIN